MAEVEGVECKGCGAALAVDPHGDPAEREPCPECGATNILVLVGATVEVDAVVFPMGIKLTSVQPQSVAIRIEQLRRALTEICTPSAAQPDKDDARQAFRNVFMNLWALKEACEHEGVAATKTRDAVNADLQIARAMDLGNLAKHNKLTKRPWSSEQPAFVEVEVEKLPGANEWITDELVSFAGQKYSGLAITKDALAAWEQLAQGWGLL